MIRRKYQDEGGDDHVKNDGKMLMVMMLNEERRGKTFFGLKEGSEGTITISYVSGPACQPASQPIWKSDTPLPLCPLFFEQEVRPSNHQKYIDRCRGRVFKVAACISSVIDQ